MKSVKHSIAALALIALGFASCNKETGVAPATSPSAASSLFTATGTVTGSIGFFNAAGTSISYATVNEEIAIKGSFAAFSCGKVQLHRTTVSLDPVTGLPVETEETIAQHDMVDGTYEFKVSHDLVSGYKYSVHYVPNGKDCNNGSNWTIVMPLEVKPACSGFNLAVTKGSATGNNVSFDLVATNCTGAPITFKLQGGLIAGATLEKVGKDISTTSISNQNGFSFSEKNKNTVLTWNVTLKDGETFSTTVAYLASKGLAEGMNLSGTWSAKDVANVVPAATLPNIILVKNTPTVVAEPMAE